MASNMKQIVCEMCGGTDLLKQDGVFICQSCGTKYSVEEAKKMMAEGTVDVSGTVKVDYSGFVKKYLENARRAREKTDWEEVEKYYNMVEQNEPHNIEAVFYSSYGKAMLSLTEADRFKRQQKFDVFCKSESVIDDYYEKEKSEELKSIIEQMSQDLIRMTTTNFVYNKTTSGNITSDDTSYTYAMFAKAEVQFIESIENIIEKDEQPYLYEILLVHYGRCIKNIRVDRPTSESYREKMIKVNLKMKELDPNFVEKEVPNIKVGGCYVATAVYGSYDCPQVWTLRRYRDYSLAKTWYGRTFIRTYYTISPTLVKWFGNTTWFKKLWRGKLDRMIKKLQAEGIESTPYQDIDWNSEK